jgi:hypothetical protein
MTDSALYILTPPVPFRAGFVGTGDASPFYHHCADCTRATYPDMPDSDAEQPITAVLAAPGLDTLVWDAIRLVQLDESDSLSYTPAVFCAQHAQERWPQEFCPECGQPDNCGDCDHTPITEAVA